MAYKIGFPNMTRFQREYGGQGVTGATGIIPYAKTKIEKPLAPINESKLARVRKNIFGK